MTKDVKMETVAIAMEGKALAWFQFVEDRLKFRHWDDFKEALLMQFRSEQEGTLCHKFLAVKQETMVEDYLEKYETLVSPLRNLPDAVMEGAFTNG